MDSTTDFGSVCEGSSPSESTILLFTSKENQTLQLLVIYSSCRFFSPLNFSIFYLFPILKFYKNKPIG